MLTRHLSTNWHRALPTVRRREMEQKEESQKTVACQRAPGLRFFRLLAAGWPWQPRPTGGAVWRRQIQENGREKNLSKIY